jgi:hypothetical protein
MIIILIIAAVILIVLLAGRLSLSIQFDKQVKSLFALSNPISGRFFSQEQLDGLPDPVQAYFKCILKEDQPYISYARIKHDGQFKTGLDKGSINIKGEQYATTGRPGFIWKGSTIMFTAIDRYIKDSGRLAVSLFSLFPIVDGSGETFDQGEILRWLGESVMYPTNLLPSEILNWTAIDALNAKLTFNYNGLSLFFLVTFNPEGEIIQMETERYMDKDHLETWIIKLAVYKELNNILIPTAFEVCWKLKGVDLSYAKFYIKEIEYDRPHRF